MSHTDGNDMITDNPDTNSRLSESPSSRPMTLRQQLAHLPRAMVSTDDNYPTQYRIPLDDLVLFCQEIAREALESLLDSELANTCVCQLADTAVCDHNWSLCNEIRERLSQQDTRSTVSDTEHSEIAPGQLTQKPPRYPNGRDEPCEICGDGGHTEIACPNQKPPQPPQGGLEEASDGEQ